MGDTEHSAVGRNEKDVHEALPPSLLLLSQSRAAYEVLLRGAGGLFQHAPFCVGDAAMNNLVLVEDF